MSTISGHIDYLKIANYGPDPALEEKIKSLEYCIRLLREEINKDAKIISDKDRQLAIAHRLIGRTECENDERRHRGMVYT